MKSKTVLFLIDDLFVWAGTEVHLMRLLTRLVGNDIRCLMAVVGRHTIADEFRRQQIPVFPLEVAKVFSWPAARSIYELASLIKREKVSLIVTYHTASDLLGPLAARLAGVPVLSCRRDEGFTKKPIHFLAQRPVNHLLTGMITVSEGVAREVVRREKYQRERIRVIPNGEDLQKFAPGSSTVRAELGLSDENCLIVCVSSLSPVKDHQTLLTAYARLAAKFPHTCLALAGVGSEREKLEEQAKPLGQQVRFLGHRQDVPEILRAADIFVQTSLTEGFSNSILQAMASALPVVATAVGGNTEMITPQSGLLTPVKDEAAIAAALEQLISSTQLRKEIGQAARLRTEQNYSLEVMTAAYDDAFTRAIEGTWN